MLKKDIRIYLILTFTTLFLYAPTFFFRFVYFDDNEYIFENLYIQNGLSLTFLKWAFTTFHAANWHPLTWISHALDWQLYGAWAGGHHITGTFFHIFNVLLVYILLKTWFASYKSALAAALIFALHPIHVESVAWVSERKDLLSTFFGLLTLLFYTKSKTTEASRVSASALAIFFYILSLLSKPMMITLPAVMVLIDFTYLKKEESLSLKTMAQAVVEKWVYLLFAACSVAVTYAAQTSGGAVQFVQDYPLLLRISNAVLGYARYVLKFFTPTNLSFFYPYKTDIPILWVLISLIGFGLYFFFAAKQWKKNNRFFLTGGLIFFITLLPVIGLIQVGAQSMADRYLYFPMLGLLMISCQGAEMFIHRSRLNRRFLLYAGLGVLAVMTALTALQIHTWRNSFTLFQHALRVDSENWFAHTNLRGAYGREGNHEKAATHLIKAMKIYPKVLHMVELNAVDFYMMGKVHLQKNESAQALSFFKAARLESETKPELQAMTRKLNTCIQRLETQSDPSRCLF